jgi:hypothetical protein
VDGKGCIARARLAPGQLRVKSVVLSLGRPLPVFPDKRTSRRRSVSDPSLALAHGCQFGCESTGACSNDSTLGLPLSAGHERYQTTSKIRSRDNDQQNRNSAAARKIHSWETFATTPDTRDRIAAIVEDTLKDLYLDNVTRKRIVYRHLPAELNKMSRDLDAAS